MSRHRNVRNLDLDEELDVYDGDDYHEEDSGVSMGSEGEIASCFGDLAMPTVGTNGGFFVTELSPEDQGKCPRNLRMPEILPE